MREFISSPMVVDRSPQRSGRRSFCGARVRVSRCNR